MAKAVSDQKDKFNKEINIKQILELKIQPVKLKMQQENINGRIDEAEESMNSVI